LQLQSVPFASGDGHLLREGLDAKAPAHFVPTTRQNIISSVRAGAGHLLYEQ